MFSSHTIFTLTFILALNKYFYNKYLAVALVCLQIAIAFLIVAARKHYTLDVLTALYVVPMIWYLLEAYHEDPNNRNIGINVNSIKAYYDVDITADLYGVDAEVENPSKSPSLGPAADTPQGTSSVPYVKQEQENNL